MKTITRRALTGMAFMLIFAACGTTAFAQTGVLKWPYLIYPGTNSQMEVLWQDKDTETTNTLSWGTDTTYSLGTVTVPEQPSTSAIPHQHMYTITGLNPSTKYYYKVADAANGVYGTGSFITAPPTNATSVKFIAQGDSRSQPFFLDSLDAAIIKFYKQPGNSAYQALSVANGDWVSSDGETYWTSQWFDPTKSDIVQYTANTPINGVKGNHDNTSGYSATFPKYFPFPYPNATLKTTSPLTDSTGNPYYQNLYWSFDYGPVHFTIIDEYSSMAPGSAQYAWVVNDLASTSKPWKIVIYHEPAYSAGSDGDNTAVRVFEGSGGLTNVFSLYNVDLIFCGHSHNYARTGAYNSAQAGSDPIALNLPHITSGGGGAPIYQPDYRNLPTNYPHVITAWASLEFMTFNINGETLEVTAYQVNNANPNTTTLIPPSALSISPIETLVLNHFTNVSSQVSVTSAPVTCSSTTCTGSLTVTNTGSASLNGNVDVVMDGMLYLQGIGNANNQYSTAGISGSGAGPVTSKIAQNTGLLTDVTLVNATGSNNGEPMIRATSSGLAAGASVVVPLTFNNPNSDTINFCSQSQLPSNASICLNPVVFQE